MSWGVYVHGRVRHVWKVCVVGTTTSELPKKKKNRSWCVHSKNVTSIYELSLGSARDLSGGFVYCMGFLCVGEEYT